MKPFRSVERSAKLMNVFFYALILFFGFLPLFSTMPDWIALIILLVAIAVLFLVVLPQSFLSRLFPPKLDRHAEEYHLAVEDLEKIYVGKKTKSFTHYIFCLTIILFVIESILNRSSISFLGLPIERYFLILWLIWWAVIFCQNYLYKRILLNKNRDEK